MPPEAEFWNLASQAAHKNIKRSRLAQLAKLIDNWDEALSILREVISSKSPSAYLGAIISNKRAELQHSIPSKNKEPEIVFLGRLNGYRIRKTATSSGRPAWWMGGMLYDERGVDIGA